MEPLLFLCHRIPYPPNKGDKVRSYHFLRRLAEDYRVHLGTFVDDPADLAHVGHLRELCADVHVETLRPAWSRALSARGLLTGEALTLPYYRSASLRRWADGAIRGRSIVRAFVFSSAMAQYVLDAQGLRRVIDFVDVDSEKWRQYGSERPGLAGWIYGREADRLLAFERKVSRTCEVSVFVTPAEAQLFVDRAPECAGRVTVIGNGVDSDYFSPAHAFASPFASDERAVVFTGAMDYWPNAQAAIWFAREILPLVRQRHGAATFYVVGMNPTAEVRALARETGLVVTGTVPDVRPYLKHATVVVAPLRLARGVQNKVLEAMAMARPVVASATCAAALVATPGVELEVAGDANGFAEKVGALFEADVGNRIGRAARQRVVTTYSWGRTLARLSKVMEGADLSTSEPVVRRPAGRVRAPRVGATR